METEVLVKDLIEPDNNIINFLLKHPVVIPSSFSALGTLVIAIITCLGYNKIIVNKINEKQLNKVLELIEEIQKINLIIYTQKSKNDKFSKVTKNIITIGNEYKKYCFFQKNANKIPFYLYPLDAENIDLMRLEQISKYKDDILIPEKIRKILYLFTVSESLEEEDFGVDTNNENSLFLYKWDDKTKDALNKYPLIIISDNTYDAEIAYGFPNRLIRVKKTDTNIYSAYDNWFYFQKNCNKLVWEINKWLRNNNVKGVNLCSLDNTKTKDD